MATTKKTKRRRPVSKSKGSVPAVTAEIQSAEEKFNRDLLTRGDAAALDENGNLPLDATHEIVKTSKESTPVLQRRRFKMF
jgi:hypothetical protein